MAGDAPVPDAVGSESVVADALPPGIPADAEHFVSAFFDESGAGADDFGVVPELY